MSDDPESSNPFETLSDDPILHILSFLPGADLLKLSTMDKNFKRIITESRETMSKIPLVLDFHKHKSLDLNYAIKLAQTRRFTALRVNCLCMLTDADAKVKLGMLLQMLSSSVDNLAVCRKISRELLSSIISMFLPNLKKCTLVEVWFNAEAAPITEEIGPRSNVNHPLQSLELIETHASEFLQLFSGCNQLKTFCYDYRLTDGTSEDIVHVNNFLATQDRLEKLIYEAKGIAWSRLTCFQLKELTAECLPGIADELAAAEFLKKLPNLAKLNVIVTNHPSRRLVEEICRAPKLEKLTIQNYREDDEDDNEDSLEGLVNRRVKELHIEDFTGIASKLLKIFIGIDSVYFHTTINVLDLSDVPYGVIMKIKRNDIASDEFVVKFSPRELPANVAQFQSAVMKFAGKCSTVITGIEIGHESWRTNGAFRLSNSFCEKLVNRLPYLYKFEVFNIADRGKFLSFLDKNQGRLQLENVDLHEPNGAGEPKPKKMKINAD